MLPEEKRINSKEQLKDWIDYEMVEKYGGGTQTLDFFELSEKAILRKHQRILRKTEYYTNTKKKVLTKIYIIRLYRMQNKYGMHIPINCCAKGLKIMHVGPVIMNKNAIVGEDCSFHMNTGLCAGGHSDDAPILDGCVVVGIGAIVLGKTRIAKNVVIGANAVVNKDILEEDIAVAGVPAKKISNNGRSSWGNSTWNRGCCQQSEG